MTHLFGNMSIATKLPDFTTHRQKLRFLNEKEGKHGKNCIQCVHPVQAMRERCSDGGWCRLSYSLLCRIRWRCRLAHSLYCQIHRHEGLHQRLAMAFAPSTCLCHHCPYLTVPLLHQALPLQPPSSQRPLTIPSGDFSPSLNFFGFLGKPWIFFRFN